MSLVIFIEVTMIIQSYLLLKCSTLLTNFPHNLHQKRKITLNVHSTNFCEFLGSQRHRLVIITKPQADLCRRSHAVGMTYAVMTGGREREAMQHAHSNMCTAVLHTSPSKWINMEKCYVHVKKIIMHGWIMMIGFFTWLASPTTTRWPPDDDACSGSCGLITRGESVSAKMIWEVCLIGGRLGVYIF